MKRSALLRDAATGAQQAQAQAQRSALGGPASAGSGASAAAAAAAASSSSLTTSTGLAVVDEAEDQGLFFDEESHVVGLGASTSLNSSIYSMSTKALQAVVEQTDTHRLETGDCVAAKDDERPHWAEEEMATNFWEKPYRVVRLAGPRDPETGRFPEYTLSAGQPMCVAGTTVGPLYTAGCMRADPLDRLVYAGPGLRSRLRLHQQRPARLLREWLAEKPYWRPEWRWIFCGWKHGMDAVREGRLLPLMHEAAREHRLMPLLGWPPEDPPPRPTFVHAWTLLLRVWVAYFCVMPHERSASPIGYVLQAWVDTMLDLSYALTRGEQRFDSDVGLMSHPRYQLWRPRRERVVLAGGLPNLVGQSAPWGMWINTPNLTLEPHVMMARIIEKLLDHRCAFRNISEVVEAMNMSNSTIAYFLLDAVFVSLMGMYPHCNRRPAWRTRQWIRSQLITAAGLPHTQFLVWIYDSERLVLYALKEFYMYLKAKDAALGSALARLTYTPQAHTFVIGLMDQVREWFDTLPLDVLWGEVQTAGLHDLINRLEEEELGGGAAAAAAAAADPAPAWRASLGVGSGVMCRQAFDYYAGMRDAMFKWQAKINAFVLAGHKDNFACQWKRHESPNSAAFFGFHMAAWLKDKQQDDHRANLKEKMMDMPERCQRLLAYLRRTRPSMKREEHEAMLNQLTHWHTIVPRLEAMMRQATSGMNPESKEYKDMVKSVPKYLSATLDLLIAHVDALREEMARLRRAYGNDLRGAPEPTPRLKKRQPFRWAKAMERLVKKAWPGGVEPLPVTLADVMSVDHVRRCVYVKSKNSFAPDPLLTPDEAFVVERAAAVAIERVLSPDPIIPLRWMFGLGLTQRGYDIFVNTYVSYEVLDESDNSMLTHFAELFEHSAHDYALIQRYMTALRWLTITQVWVLPEHVHVRQRDALYRARGILPYQEKPAWLGGLRLCRCGTILERVHCLDGSDYAAATHPRFNTVRNSVQCMAGHHVCQLEPLLIDLCGRVLRSGTRTVSICVQCGDFVECGNSTWTGDGPVCPVHITMNVAPVRRPEVPADLLEVPALREWVEDREDRAVAPGASQTARCYACRRLRPVARGWADTILDDTTGQLMPIFLCQEHAKHTVWSIKRVNEHGNLFRHQLDSALEQAERYETYRALKRMGMGRAALMALRKANREALHEDGLGAGQKIRTRVALVTDTDLK